MSCIHVETLALRPPSDAQAVYREDCTQCFDSIDDPDGLDVCLSCFNGGCSGERNHAVLHAISKDHPLVLNIRRTRRIPQDEEPPKKITKISIAPVTEVELYDYHTKIRCLHCNIDSIDKSIGVLADMVDSIMNANTYSRKEEVKAWEQVYTSCEHILCLNQEPSRQIESQNLGRCSLCDLRENLWLCLECGNLGCGRAQFGGLQGNSHGLEHKNRSGHSVAVKLGSITPEGTADVYCYACDEERIDENLGSHLAHWGIILAERQKTEKSLTEMQIDENSRWEFSMTDNDGHELKRLHGSGFTGLKNLGNSCYLASTLQCLFALPNFQERYYHSGDLPNVDDPAQDLETQLRKFGDGLLSGRYSHCSNIDHGSGNNADQKGIAPSMLKALIGKGHPEFSTMRQQDAFEFLLHVFNLITRSKHVPPLKDPIRSFRFVLEQRLQCISCKKVRYQSNEQDNISILVPVRKLPTSNENLNTSADKPVEYEAVSLKECLDNFTSDELVELNCSSCGSKDGFLKRSLFKTFPEILIVNARRFIIINWVPTKVNVPVFTDDEQFNMDDYISPGHQPWEELFPDSEEDSAKPEFIPNEDALQQIECMGFTRNQCTRALHATGNADVGSAMDWLFSHLEDPDIDTPLEVSSSVATMSDPAVAITNIDDPEKVEMLQAMGFSLSSVRKALRETGGDLERAVDWLFNHPDDQGEFSSDAIEVDLYPENKGGKLKEIPGSNELPINFQLSSIICHKGASIHSGHYVAFIRKKVPEDFSLTWVLYNDEKVVQANDIEEMKKFAYVYLFQRV
ncbi:putative ubiquitin carboxyl-terminal hydrolase [Erysiphe necator]|uniref:Ubiquitin carboxyl-terminal hydrolase n=1 Tax=Uncinula necator TaxID=52586 RepID=A0A0B1P7M0_UNCNE|nr:putative ubiquitin carboxyl-terminal hydrolase [Erysiphe necator]